MEADAEVAAAMAADSPTTRAAMAAVAATEVAREVMEVAATKMSRPAPKLCTVQMLNIKYSPCFVTTIKQFPYLNYSHLLLYRHLLPTLADLQLISH